MLSDKNQPYAHYVLKGSGTRSLPGPDFSRIQNMFALHLPSQKHLVQFSEAFLEAYKTHFLIEARQQRKNKHCYYPAHFRALVSSMSCESVGNLEHFEAMGITHGADPIVNELALQSIEEKLSELSDDDKQFMKNWMARSLIEVIFAHPQGPRRGTSHYF